MKTRLFAVSFLVVIGAGTSGDLMACGDKFLVPSRGTRYERSLAARQASAVLIYANPASPFSQTLARLSVQPGLQKAGYEPTTVTSESELARAVQDRQYDLVLVDGTDGQRVGQLLQGSPAPHVVPVLHQPTKTDLKQAKTLYRVVLSDPRGSRTFIGTIDEAMDVRQAEAKAATKKAVR